MRYRVGVENNMEGRSCVWALENPGCFAYGRDSSAALAAAEAAIREYAAWIASHGVECWLTTDEIEICPVESWDVYDIDEEFNRVERGYSVNAFFEHDWKPLTAVDLERGKLILTWSRQDLLRLVENLSEAELQAAHPGERWSIAGILGHVGGAEWWYLDRLGLAFPREQVPADPFDRVDAVRSRLMEVLPQLEASRLVVGVDGEFWSPRKLLRRAAWHERDHIQHIQRLIGQV